MLRQAVFALGILAVFAFMVTVQVKLGKRAWVHHEDIHQFHDEKGKTDDTTEGMRDGLTEWLQNPRIVRTMLTTHTASKDYLQTTQLAVPVMRAIQIRSTCKALLRNRDVRRVIAVEFMRLRGWPKEKHSQVLASLAEYAQLEPQRTAAAREQETA